MKGTLSEANSPMSQVHILEAELFPFVVNNPLEKICHQVEFSLPSEDKMRWVSPFDNFSKAAQIRLIVVTFAMSAILLFAMRTLDAPLRTQAATKGIVSFELAKNYDASRQILNSWNTEAKIYAALSLGLDYLFLIVYAIFISLACIQVATALKGDHSFFFCMGLVLAWAQFLAAILDAIENLALIHLLMNSSRKWLPCLARWCAIVKFSVVSAGLIFILGGLLVIGLKKIFKRFRMN